MNHEIFAWLHSERQYQTGVQLYAQFGPSQYLKRILLLSEPCSEHLDTMVHELSLLVEEQAAPIERTGVTAEPVATVIAAETIVESCDYHGDDRLLFEQIKEKLKYRDLLHAGLEQQTPENRRKNALLILDISDQITRDYQRHNHFIKHGVLPSVQPEKVKTPSKPVDQLSDIELHKYKANVRSKISYYKRLIADPLASEKILYNSRVLEAWEKELAEILKLQP